MSYTPRTRVVHVNRDEYDVYIGRQMRFRPDLKASGWGNPFRSGDGGDVGSAIERYRHWVVQQPHLVARLHELKGKALGCWCAPKGGILGNLYGRCCHGEVLAALADQLPEEAPLIFIDEIATYTDAEWQTLADLLNPKRTPPSSE